MKIRLPLLASSFVLALSLTASAAEKELRVSFCTPNTDFSFAAPLAAAQEFGWFKEKNIAVRLIPIAGSTDCVLNVSSGQLDAALAAPEAVTVFASKGGQVSYYYTAFNRNMFGIAVADKSPVQSYADLKGKRIGVTSMSSVGVVIARSVIKTAGLDPDKDISIVVSGSPLQSKLLLENGEVDALSQWDMIYENISQAGLPMRKLADENIQDFPSNGFVALKEKIASNGDDLAALARGYAMGSLYVRAHPEEAAKLAIKYYPQVAGTGKSEEEVLTGAKAIFNAASRLWELPQGQTKVGFNRAEQYDGYSKWLTTRGVIAQPVPGEQIITNELIDKINDFDAAVAANPK